MIALRFVFEIFKAMSFGQEMRSYWLGSWQFVTRGNVGVLLVLGIPDVGHMLSSSEPDFPFLFLQYT